MGPVLDGSADEEYKEFVSSVLGKMANVERELYTHLTEQEREAVSRKIGLDQSGVLAANRVNLDLQAVNKALGFPRPPGQTSVPNASGVNAATGPRGDAAVFGFIILAYSCCNGDGSGVILGVGVRNCGSGFTVAGCP